MFMCSRSFGTTFYFSQDDDLGFVVLNKPGNVPLHSTLSNHSETVISKFTMALCDKGTRMHVSVPREYPAIDTEAQGLVCLSTKPNFSAFMTNLVKQEESHAASSFYNGESDSPGLKVVYKCLVCIKEPSRMGLLEAFQKSGKLITNYWDPAHHRYVRCKPTEMTGDDGGRSNHWSVRQLRIKQVGDEKFPREELGFSAFVKSSLSWAFPVSISFLRRAFPVPILWSISWLK